MSIIPPPSHSRLMAVEAQLQNTIWPQQEAVYYQTFERVLNGFVKYKVGEEHFLSVTGYGHDDLGRDVTDAVFAHALQAEAALVRVQMVSGTHALAVGLNGCLQPGDTMLSITGRPYDTLEEVIGLRGHSRQSLAAKNIGYDEISIFNAPADAETAVGYSVRTAFTEAEAQKIRQAKLVFIQRSRGYSLRPSLTIPQLKSLIEAIKAIHPHAIVMVDNCYGEFTQAEEPTAVGADLIAGSLIKNPGGGIVPAGGYVAGRADLVAACADYLTCPGVGAEGGYTFNLTRLLLQGLYLAPGIVKEALKGMTLAAKLFEEAGYDTAPHWQDSRSDIIQILTLRDPDKLVQFCQVLQSLSPINSHVTPIPANPPGYADEVVMAGGTFIDGSTLELSADGPLRSPYAVYLQGGLTYAHTRLAVQKILERLGNCG
ncbi:aminotransferase class I/II-fold pyridoxal phosphate-dependent enzyme [Vampirovibrio sp.]|uniref:methionine gamma-lyase family protein n=1 Tax=Vampirovibrio sp. TaxID=2717857 RepID=UPI0035935B62